MADRDHLRAVLLAAQEMPPGQVDELVDSLADALPPPTEPPRPPSVLSSLRAVMRRNCWGDVYSIAVIALIWYVGLPAIGLVCWYQGDLGAHVLAASLWLFWLTFVLAAIIATYGTLGRE